MITSRPFAIHFPDEALADQRTRSSRVRWPDEKLGGGWQYGNDLHHVERIIDSEKLVDVQSVEEQVWDEDSSGVLHFLGDALNNYPEQMSVYVAYIEEQPASAAWIYFPEHSQFASLWGVATINSYRKQGLFTAILAVRAQKTKARQVRYLTVDTMPMSRPILEKLGFETIAYSYPCKWKLKSQKRSIR
jgi:hypothetical protein